MARQPGMASLWAYLARPLDPMNKPATPTHLQVPTSAFPLHVLSRMKASSSSSDVTFGPGYLSCSQRWPGLGLGEVKGREHRRAA